MEIFLYDGKKEDEKEIKKNEEIVKSLGGLFIIGTERHEQKNNQLEVDLVTGRPGSTIFFISLQDELMKFLEVTPSMECCKN